MKIREVTVGDLPRFIQSDDYAELQPKPITPHRAMSQYNNPHAREEDIALIYAEENGQLVAFVGMLPHALTQSTDRVFSNSGWWVHPVLGRQMGLPLFFKAFQRCNQRMIFTDSPKYTQSILVKTGLFTYFPPIYGTRYFMRFYQGKRLMTKNKAISSALSFTFTAMNSICSLRYLFILKKRTRNPYTIKSMTQVSNDLDDFIKKHAEHAYLKQDRKKLNWITTYPWITTQTTAAGMNYPFSYKADQFKQEFLIFHDEVGTKAVFLLSIRDHHASIPFFYAEKNSLSDVSRLLLNKLIKEKVCSLIVFHKALDTALKNAGHFWLFKKNIIRFTGFSNTLHPFFEEDGYFQDGDGDAAFT
ncbi:MAG: hypothetical protein WCY58_08035 [Mariniphaga sp.]|nr:hypothetical protein [Mariniphaga sp.]MDD4425270.1 hypothetical protein [Mariniphaga sp.]